MISKQLSKAMQQLGILTHHGVWALQRRGHLITAHISGSVFGLRIIWKPLQVLTLDLTPAVYGVIPLFPSRVAVPYVSFLWNWRFLPKQGSAMHIRRLVIPEHTCKCLKLKIQTSWGQKPICLFFKVLICLFLALPCVPRCKQGLPSRCGPWPSHCDGSLVVTPELYP